jgi:hypothetical protein
MPRIMPYNLSGANSAGHAGAGGRPALPPGLKGKTPVYKPSVATAEGRAEGARQGMEIRTCGGGGEGCDDWRGWFKIDGKNADHSSHWRCHKKATVCLGCKKRYPLAPCVCDKTECEPCGEE